MLPPTNSERERQGHDRAVRVEVLRRMLARPTPEDHRIGHRRTQEGDPARGRRMLRRVVGKVEQAERMAPIDEAGSVATVYKFRDLGDER